MCHERNEKKLNRDVAYLFVEWKSSSGSNRSSVDLLYTMGMDKTMETPRILVS